MKSIRSRRKSIAQIPQSRWVAYVGAGAATALAGANSAEADIHYSGPINLAVTFGQSVDNAFALDHGGMIHFANISTSSAGVALFRNDGGSVSNMFRGSAAGNFRYPSKLAAGVNVSAGPFANFNGAFFATLAFGSGYTHSHWLTPGTGFVGFKFNGGAGVEYGWARINMTSGTPENEFIVVDYAWADAGTAIQTGQTAVPEPGSLGLLAVGAAGLLLWRKSRAKAS